MEQIKVSKEHKRLLYASGLMVATMLDVLANVIEDIQDSDDPDDEALLWRLKNIKQISQRVATRLNKLSRCSEKK